MLCFFLIVYLIHCLDFLYLKIFRTIFASIGPLFFTRSGENKQIEDEDKKRADSAHQIVIRLLGEEHVHMQLACQLHTFCKYSFQLAAMEPFGPYVRYRYSDQWLSALGLVVSSSNQIESVPDLLQRANAADIMLFFNELFRLCHRYFEGIIKLFFWLPISLLCFVLFLVETLDCAFL